MGGVAENYGRDDDLINDIFDLDDTPTKIAPLSQLSPSKNGKSKDVDKTISLMTKKNMMKARERKLNTSKTHCILKKMIEKALKYRKLCEEKKAKLLSV